MHVHMCAMFPDRAMFPDLSLPSYLAGSCVRPSSTMAMVQQYSYSLFQYSIYVYVRQMATVKAAYILYNHSRRTCSPQVSCRAS